MHPCTNSTLTNRKEELVCLVVQKETTNRALFIVRLSYILSICDIHHSRKIYIYKAGNKTRLLYTVSLASFLVAGRCEWLMYCILTFTEGLSGPFDRLNSVLEQDCKCESTDKYGQNNFALKRGDKMLKSFLKQTESLLLLAAKPPGFSTNFGS